MRIHHRHHRIGGLIATGLMLGMPLRAASLVYSVSGTISERVLQGGVDPLPGVGVGAQVNLVLSITTGVVGTPGFLGITGWPQSMTYAMPAPPPTLLAGKIGPAAFLGISGPSSVMLADVPAPNAPSPIEDRLLVYGFGNWSNSAHSGGGVIRLIFTDPTWTALSSPDLPSGPITGFPQAELSLEDPLSGSTAHFRFVPAINLIPEPMTGLLATVGSTLLVRRRRRLTRRPGVPSPL